MKATRRQFLAAASAAVAPMILPKRVFGANDRVNVGWIGCGRRAGQLRGIPEDAQKYIFNPFFTTKDPGEGTGLGLSISFNIVVKDHKGSYF